MFLFLRENTLDKNLKNYMKTVPLLYTSLFNTPHYSTSGILKEQFASLINK